MPIGHGPKRYAAIRLLALVIDLITPLAMTYLSLVVFFHYYPWLASLIYGTLSHHLLLTSHYLSWTSVKAASTHALSSLMYQHPYTTQDVLSLITSIGNATLPVPCTDTTCTLSNNEPSESVTLQAWGFFFRIGLPIYCLLETLFFLYYCREYKRLQQVAPVTPMNRYQRTRLFDRIIKELGSSDHFMDFFSGWFYKKDSMVQLNYSDFKEIKLDNAKEWITWAFFAQHSWKQVEQQFPNEMKRMLNKLVQELDVHFEPGYNDQLECVKLNYNQVEAYPKPFLLYGLIFLSESMGSLILYLMGFRYHSKDANIFKHVDMYKKLSRYPSAHFSYYVKLPQESSAVHSIPNLKTPLCFFHGIGGGLFCYLQVIYKVLRNNPDRPIFLVELPHVSMRLMAADMVVGMSDFVKQVELMLKQHHFTKATFAGHSLGTIYCAWMVKYSKMALGVVLIDPVCFKLYHSHLAFRFVHRLPQTAPEFLMHWVVSRELYISHYISRHFVWHHNVLFPDDLPPASKVYVALDDQLIDGHDVWNYLTQHGVDGEAWYMDHAEFLFRPRIENEIVKGIQQVTESVDKMVSRNYVPTEQPVYETETESADECINGGFYIQEDASETRSFHQSVFDFIACF